MAKIIEMPKLSDTMTSGTLLSWLKKEGDKVAAGDMIASIETDKATMDVENFEDGILLKQFVKAGEEVEIGAAICAIGEKGEKVEAPAKKDSEKEDKKEEKPAKEGKKEKKEESKASSEPKKEKEESKPAASSGSGDRVKVSPLARKVAAEKGVSLAGITGTGPGGRIVRADVLNAPAGGSAPATGALRPMGLLQSETIAEESDIPVTKIRGIIAKRLIESKTQIPHFYLELEVNMEPLLNLRSQINNMLAGVPADQGGMKLSVNDFILKASAEALRRVPAVNTSWEGDSVRQHGRAHVSFAVAIDEGLVTPVITDCHLKNIREISAEAKSLAKKARDKKLTPAEMTGGTFCISNLGMMGIERFCAIINPPNTAILAVGATVKKPVVVDDQIVIGQRMSLTLSADHRVVDGAVGAEFLSALKHVLENPALIIL